MWGKQLAAMLAIYTGKGVVPEVNIRGCILHIPLPSVNKAGHSGFETQRICHQKFKTGVSVAPKMDMCPPKIFLKKVEPYPFWSDTQEVVTSRTQHHAVRGHGGEVKGRVNYDLHPNLCISKQRFCK